MGRVNLGNGTAKPVKKMRGGGMTKKMRGGGMTKKMRGGGMVKKLKDGSLPMTTVDGKKVPKFAADGKGKNDLVKKARGGGMVKKLDKGGPSKTDEDKNQENYDKAIRKIAKQNKKGKK